MNVGRPPRLSPDAKRRPDTVRLATKMMRHAEITLTGNGIRNLWADRRAPRVTGLPKGGLLLVTGAQRAGTIAQYWRKEYEKEVERTVDGWVAVLHPTESRGDVVEMSWPEFQRIVQLLQGGE